MEPGVGQEPFVPAYTESGVNYARLGRVSVALDRSPRAQTCGLSSRLVLFGAAAGDWHEHALSSRWHFGAPKRGRPTACSPAALAEGRGCVQFSATRFKTRCAAVLRPARQQRPTPSLLTAPSAGAARRPLGRPATHGSWARARARGCSESWVRAPEA